MGDRAISYKKRFKFRDEQSDYVFQLKKRNWKYLWWLLLIPLLLMLFVRCEKDIHVRTIDPILNNSLSDVHVTLEYTAHYLLKNGEFFFSEPITREIQTDGDGKGTFEDLPCSVFSYIFRSAEKATYTAWATCYFLDPDPESSNFHYVRKKKLWMSPKTIDLGLSILDRETDEPLAGAVLEYEYVLCGNDVRDSVATAPDGRCTLKNIPECGTVSINRVRCYGYADTTDVEIMVKTALNNPDSSKIRLTPLKQSFTYFVKNKYTKQPIPGATVVVTLTSGNGTVVRGQSVTNVDGKGAGAYQDAFVLAHLDLQASKIHYKDGKLKGNHIVEKFAALPDEQRTIYLEPEPYLEEFQNMDSLSMTPIAGVQNVIRIVGVNGKTSREKEISNRNGVFYVKAMEGDKIEIDSNLSPDYEPKHTKIDSFAKGEIILMKPVLVDLTFTTSDGETEDLLPDCALAISTSISRINTPNNSGKGAFVVRNLRLAEDISITASKTGYAKNENKIRNASVLKLFNSVQEQRDIPLFPDLPPCNSGGDATEAQYKAQSIKSYNMGQKSGRFRFSWDNGGGIPDQILVYNCREDEMAFNTPIFDTGMTAGKDSRYISFSNGPVITVLAISSQNTGTSWNYTVSCPE